ncbi:MAG: single-stranded DNA-binding protein [Candidatus Thiodiazotropha lotti]
MSKGTINKVTLIGFAGRDAEMRFMPNGTPVTNVSLATTESWKDKKTGEPRERTEWHRVVFFNKVAEIAAEYIKKGTQVFVEGGNRTRKYEKDGEDRYITEVICNEMQMMGKKPQSVSASNNFDAEISDSELAQYESLAEATGHGDQDAE